MVFTNQLPIYRAIPMPKKTNKNLLKYMRLQLSPNITIVKLL